MLILALAVAQPRAQCANTWQLLGAQAPNGRVGALTFWDPDGAGPQPEVLVVGGSFSAVGALPAPGLALFAPSTSTWSTLPGLAGGTAILASATLPNGDLVVAGSFAAGSGVTGNVARWNGTSWSAFGTGANGQVNALLVLPNGQLVAGGSFTMAGGVPASGVATWNGASWSPMPALGATLFGVPTVVALAARGNGDIVAAGLFTVPGGAHLARWDGASWSAIATSAQVHTALHVLPNDDVLVGNLSGVHRWNGTSLSPVGSGLPIVHDIAVLPDGDLLAAVDAVGFAGVARWNGTTWSDVAGGVNDDCHVLLADRTGDVWVGGAFTSLATTWTPLAGRLARLSTTCGAAAATGAPGCAGSGGMNVLTPVTLPWIGSTFRARATGMPSTAFVLSVYGFAPLSIPIASVHPAGLPGCSVLATTELTDVLFPVTGAVDTQLALPDAPSLVGTTFHHYVVPIEVDALLTITAISNSNSLTCAVGAF